jgi:hypothetical protein
MSQSEVIWTASSKLNGGITFSIFSKVDLIFGAYFGE